MNQALHSSKNLTVFVLFISCQVIFSSCGMRFYKSINIPKENHAEKIESAIANNTYIIVHQRDVQWHLAKPAPSATDGKKYIIGQTEDVGKLEAEMRDRIERNKMNKGNLVYSSRFGPRNTASHQIHLFITDSLTITNELKIPYSEISKVDDYVTAPGATFISHLLMNTIPPAIVLAIACNCPYVYSYDNSKLNFEGNLYSGAIYPNLERYDYLTIPNMAVTDGKYKFRLENPRDDEQQFTNFMQMMVVNHSHQVKVLPDRKGILHTIKELQSPDEALSFDLKNHKEQIVAKDGQFYQFADDQDIDPLNGIVMKFKNELKNTKPKLVLSLKNSEWAGYIYKEVVSLFGSKLPVWQKKKMKHTTEEINARSVTEGSLMSVYLNTKNGWKFIDYVNTPGSITLRDVILPIELADETNDIEIMLKGGFRFWDLDYAALDFSADEALQVDYLPVKSVLDSLGKDYSAALSFDDKNYLNQLTISDKFEITFDNIPKKDNLSQTMILNAKGYYNRLDKFAGKIQIGELLKIKKSSFSAYSKKKFFEITNLYAATKP